jgi:hypothetical protein
MWFLYLTLGLASLTAALFVIQDVVERTVVRARRRAAALNAIRITSQL